LAADGSAEANRHQGRPTAWLSSVRRVVVRFEPSLAIYHGLSYGGAIVI